MGDLAELNLAIRSDQVKHATADLDRLSAASRRAENQSRNASGQFQRENSVVAGLRGQYSQLIGALGGVASAYALVRTASQSIKLAAQFEQTEIAFETLLGSAAKARQLVGDLQRFGAETPFQFKGLADTSRLMLALGFQADKLLPTLKALGDATAAFGGNEQLMQRLALALGQMQAKGKVSGEEMRQLAEAGIPAWQMLADVLKTDVRGAMDLAEKGAINSSEAVNALLTKIQERYAGSMQKQSRTLAGLYSTFKDYIEITMADIGKTIVEALDMKGKLEGGIAVLGEMRKVIVDVVRAMAGLPPQFAGTEESVHKVIAVLKIVGGVIGAILAYKVIGFMYGFGASMVEASKNAYLLIKSLLSLWPAILAITVAIGAFKIGSWMYENFAGVQKWGAGFWKAMSDLWTGVKYIWNSALAYLLGIFDDFWGTVAKMQATAIGLIASGFEKIGGDAFTAWAKELRGVEAQLQNIANLKVSVERSSFSSLASALKLEAGGNRSLSEAQRAEMVELQRFLKSNGNMGMNELFGIEYFNENSGKLERMGYQLVAKIRNLTSQIASQSTEAVTAAYDKLNQASGGPDKLAAAKELGRVLNDAQAQIQTANSLREGLLRSLELAKERGEKIGTEGRLQMAAIKSDMDRAESQLTYLRQISDIVQEFNGDASKGVSLGEKLTNDLKELDGLGPVLQGAIDKLTSTFKFNITPEQIRRSLADIDKILESDAPLELKVKLTAERDSVVRDLAVIKEMIIDFSRGGEDGMLSFTRAVNRGVDAVRLLQEAFGGQSVEYLQNQLKAGKMTVEEFVASLTKLQNLLTGGGSKADPFAFGNLLIGGEGGSAAVKTSKELLSDLRKKIEAMRTEAQILGIISEERDRSKEIVEVELEIQKEIASELAKVAAHPMASGESVQKIMELKNALEEYRQAFRDLAAAQEYEEGRKDLEELLEGLDQERKLLFLSNKERERRSFLMRAEEDLIKMNPNDRSAVEAELSKLDKEFRDFQKLKDIEEVANGIGAAFGRAFDDIIWGAKSAREALGDFFMDISRMVMQKAVTEPLVNLVSGLVGNIGAGISASFGFTSKTPAQPNALGNVFSLGQKIMAFAAGGVVDKATLFPMRGGLGLMGEAGPEAIMPLTRDPGGKLSIRVYGGDSGISMPITRGPDGRLGIAMDMKMPQLRHQLEKYLSVVQGERERINAFSLGDVFTNDSFSGLSQSLTFPSGGEMASRMSQSHGSRSESRGGVTIINNMTVNAKDAGSFKRSERQISRRFRGEM